MSDHKHTARRRFEEIEPELRQISRWMYEHPELGYQEHESSHRLSRFLAEHGFEVEAPAYGLDTAFVARAGRDGPEVIICAEYDALPDVGHACGHNIIATAALGAGYALAEAARDLGFRVTVLGTPAEEHYGGKIELIEAGAFEGATAAMMIHPAPDDVLDPSFLAVRHVELHYHGKEAHAAATPQEGINALDAFVQAYVNVSTLRQHLYPTDKIHGIITKGGAAPNVIPAHTESSWYIRAEDSDRLADLFERVLACFEAAARATGCTWDVSDEGRPYERLVTNPALAELFKANAEVLGREMKGGASRPVGAAGSTDMGNVSQLLPSIHPFLDINSLPAVNHQREFAAHTVTADGDRALRDGALAMAWTVLDLATQERWDDLDESTP